MEDLHPTFSNHQYEVMNSLDDFTAAHYGNFQHLETGINSRPTKILETNSLNSSTGNLSSPLESSSPNIIGFGIPDSPPIYPHQQQNNFGNLFVDPLLVNVPNNCKDHHQLLPPGKSSCTYNNNALKASPQGVKRSNTSETTHKTLPYNQDHIMAERKRREKLNEQFIALSAIVPALKKMDKTSLLGEAIRYLKQMEERVKTLEEQTARKTMESVVFVNKSRLSADDETAISSSDEKFINQSNESLLEIKAKVSDKNILIRIHCAKQKGVLAKLVAEVEKFHLTVTNSCAMQFGDSALDITVLAKMDVGFCVEVKDLVRNLRSTFLQLM